MRGPVVDLPGKITRGTAIIVAAAMSVAFGIPWSAAMADGRAPLDSHSAKPKRAPLLKSPKVKAPKPRPEKHLAKVSRSPKTPKKVKELTGKRTALSSTWRNDDGSLTVERYLSPRYYKAGNGEWQVIDSDLSHVPGKGGVWESGANAWRVRFASPGSDQRLEEITQGQNVVSLSPRDVADPGIEPKVTGSTATYSSLWDGVDLIEEVGATQIKESIVLQDASAPTTYRFDITGATPRARRDGGVTLAANGKDIATIPAPTVTTADKVGVDNVAAAEARMDVVGDRIEITISDDWLASLPASAFPAVIDPTYNPGGYNYPSSVISYSSTGATSNTEVRLGSNSQGTWDSAVSIPLPPPPAQQNGQPWQLGYTSLALSCQSSCTLSDVHAWNEASQPTSYNAVQTGGTVPAFFDATFDQLFVFTGNSTYANGQSSWIGISANAPSGPYVQIPTNAVFFSFRYYELPPPAEITSPTDGATLATTTPTLTTTVTDAQICGSILDTGGTCDMPYDVHYDFKVSTAPDGEPGQVVADSGWIEGPYTQDANGNFTMGTPTWTVPAGSLVDGVTYYASVQVTNTLILYPSDENSGNILIDPPAGAQISFKVKLRLSSGGPSPTDTVGSVPGQSDSKSDGTPSPGTMPSSETVNMVTGNLAVTVGTPQMQTISGPAGITLHYNSMQSSTSGTAAAGGSSYGLRGQYYKDSGSHTFPSSSPVGTRVDPVIDLHGGYGAAPIGGIDPDTGTPGAGYLVRWIGRISLPAAASVPTGTTFTLGGATSGGMRIILDGTTIYDDWNGTTTPVGARVFGNTSLAPGTSGALEVDYWEPNVDSETLAQFWVDEDIPANDTHAEFLVPSTWLQTTATGLPPGWTYGGSDLAWTSVSDLGSQVVVNGSSGYTLTFTREADGSYSPPTDNDSSLTISNGKIQMSTTSGYVYAFNADGSLQSAFSASDDTHPAALHYSYAPVTAANGSPVLLDAIADPVSTREISMTYGGQSGCPAANNAPDAMLCQIDLWDGTVADLSYNSNQQLAGLIGEGNATTLFGYTSDNQLNTIRDALASDYVAAGLSGSSGCSTSSSSTACQFDTAVTYDSAGRAASVTQPAPQAGQARPQRTYTYQPSSATPGAGTTLVEIAGFDPSGNAAIPAGYAYSRTYDAQTRVVSETDSGGLTARVIWDDQNHPIIHVGPDGLQTSSAYDRNDNLTDAYGPAPVACFTSGPTNPWPSDTDFTNPPAPIEGYLPVADPEGTAGCGTAVPHQHSGYDEGIDGLGIIYWPNGDFAGPPAAHGTGNGINGEAAAACSGSTTGSSDDSLCATWPSGTAPGETDGQGEWSMRLSGTLTVGSAGTYEFKGIDNQPISLWIDGVLVGTNKIFDAAGALTNVDSQFTGQADLAAGPHDIRLDVQGTNSTQTTYALSDRKVGQSATFTPIALTRTGPNYWLQTSATDADGKETSTAYSDGNGIEPQFGLATGTTQGVGGSSPLTTTTEYEQPGSGSYLRRTATVLPNGGRTTYTYWGATEALSNSICGVPAGTSQAGMVKASTGQAPTASDPGRRQYFVYDAAGRVAGEWVGPGDTAFSSINGSDWRCTTRDARGRVLTQTWPAFGSAPARTVTHAYAVSGNPLLNQVTDSSAGGASVLTATDLLGRLAIYVDSFSQQTYISYNRAGQITNVTGSQGAVTNAHDPDTGHVTKVSVGGQRLATAHYSATTNRLTSVDYSNGTEATLGYDPNGRQDRLTYTKTADGSLVTGNQVTMSPSGRIISELQNIDGALENANPAGANAVDYTYDDAGRLTNAYLPGSFAEYSYAANPASDGCEQPDAGANTNRTKVTITPTGGSPSSTHYCYNDADQLTKAFSGSQIDLVGTDQAGQNLSFLQPNTPISLDYPSGVEAGDQALLAVTVPKGTNITTPAGYTVVGTYQTNALLGNNATIEILRHTITSGETSVAVAFSKSSARTAILAVYRGVDPNDPVDALSGGATNAGTSVTAPSVTTTLPGDRLVVFDGQKGNASATWTPPSGSTQQATSSGGATVTAIAADAVQATPGATGDQVSTSSTSGALVTAMVALKPGDAGSTSTYDSHGNQVSDGTTTYTYDAADRLATTTVGGVTTTYVYDAVDRVIERITGNQATTIYAYGGFDSVPVATRTGSGVVQQLIPLPGGVTATIQTAGSYHPVTAQRILDTRDGTGAPLGAVAAHGNLNVQVTGVGGVPEGNVSAVAVNLAVTGPTAAGDVVAYANGSPRPGTSNLNFAAGQTIANLAIVPVGPDGTISVYNDSSGSTQIIGDIQGYYRAGTALNGGSFQPLTASRVMDTRDGTGVTQGAIAAGGTTTLQLAGVAGVPAANVSAVVLTVTAVGPTASGSVTAYPDGTTRPDTDNVQFAAGQTVSNSVIVPLGSNGKVAFYNGSSGTTQLVVDIAGYYRGGSYSGSNTGSYHALTPVRILDTQDGTGAPLGAVASNGTVALQVNGAGGVPSTCVSAVALTITATAGTAAGNLVAYPDGTAKPDASNVNYAAGQTIGNLAIIPVPANGKVDITNQSTGTVQISGDVAGYYECSSGGDNGDIWSYPDLRGNTTATADGNGDVVGAIVNYDPWGAPLASPVSTENAAVTKNFSSFGSQGKVTDPGSGITIMGARAYDSRAARFLSVDPEEGGCANAYVYTFGDPLTQLDLNGRSACGRIVAGRVAGGAAIVAAGVAVFATGGTALLLGGAAVGLGMTSTVLNDKPCHQGNKGACVSEGLGVGGLFLGGMPFLPGLLGKIAGSTSVGLGIGSIAIDTKTSQPSFRSCVSRGVSNAWSGIKHSFSGLGLGGGFSW